MPSMSGLYWNAVRSLLIVLKWMSLSDDSFLKSLRKLQEL
jgi:hypothetical protein